MRFESPDAYDAWLNRPYVDGLRRTLGNEEARARLTEEEEDAYVRDAMVEIDAMRDPDPDDDDDDDDEEEEIDSDIFLDDQIGGEG